jgi:cyclic beta-1,2-glucan synthetase
VPYYLLEPNGVKELQKALKSCSSPSKLPEIGFMRQAKRTYFSVMSIMFAVLLLGAALWIGEGTITTPIQWVFILTALLLPISEWAVTGAHWLIEYTMKPRPCLRYDFSSQIPKEAATFVVIPVIWSTVEEVQKIAERLELHYLANRNPNIHFAILSDFTDAESEIKPDDELVMSAAKESIEKLNKTYSNEEGSTFHLYQRRRLWNDSEGAWLGWERKRGKLVEFVELLRGSKNTTYNFIVGDTTLHPHIRYIISLDADTQLPLESAQRMIGTLHLPYNRPRLNPSRTYGMQIIYYMF